MSENKKYGQPFDITIIAGIDRTGVPAHRLVMSATSKYFAALLGPSYKEGSKSEVTLVDIDGATLNAIVDYCYTEKIEINAGNIYDVVHAASSLEFPEIEEQIDDFCCYKLDLKNCIELLTMADIYTLTNLWQKGMRFWAQNFDRLPLSSMPNLDEKVLQKLLAFDEIEIAEERIFHHVSKWIQRNKKKRACFPDILKLIRLKHITTKFLHERIEPFYSKHKSIDLVVDEKSARLNSDCAYINLHRFNPPNICCVCWTESVVGEPQIVIKEYDFKTNQWFHLKTIPNPIDSTAHADMINGDLFFVNFFRKNGPKNVEVGSQFCGTSALLDGVYRERYVPVAIGNYIYVFGGRGAHQTDLDSCERFDFRSIKGEQRQHMPNNSQIDAALEWNGKIYAARRNSLFCYDPDNDVWTVNPINTISSNSTVVSMYKSAKFLYIAEENGNTHEYDPLKNICKMIGRSSSAQIVSTIEHYGVTYTLRQDGTFGSENLRTIDSKESLKKLNDERVGRSSFVALYVQN